MPFGTDVLPPEFTHELAIQASKDLDLTDPDLIENMKHLAEVIWNEKIAGTSAPSGQPWRKLDDSGNLFPPTGRAAGSIDVKSGLVRLPEIRNVTDFGTRRSR